MQQKPLAEQQPICSKNSIEKAYWSKAIKFPVVKLNINKLLMFLKKRRQKLWEK